MEKAKFIWMNGSFVPWDDAKIHVLSHVVHYGTCVFEGIRCYKTSRGPAVFRLPEHTRRLFDSAKIYRMDIPYTQEQVNDIILQTIRKNGLDECYIRPIVYRGYAEMGLNPLTCPVDVCIAVWKWGKYLGSDTVEKGVEVIVSSWNRLAPNTLPVMAKAGANYMNSQLIKMEAIARDVAEGIALDINGYVSEGSAENIFLVRDGILHTPALGASILAGITRDSVIKIAKDLGYTVREEFVPREFLYLAEEAFFTGTAAEITPITTIDKIPVGDGKRGPVTKRLQDEFYKVIRGKVKKRLNWLTFV